MLQVVVCLLLYRAQHRRLTTTGSSRWAAKGQSQLHKQLASYSAYKRRVGADLSTSAARVAISVGCCATRCFDRFLCEKRRNEVLRNSIYRQAARYASEVYY